MANSQFDYLLKLILSAENTISEAKGILMELVENPDSVDFTAKAKQLAPSSNEDNVVEGVFNGEFMIDKNGKQYPVAANYASKSKLVGGDVLKLTIKEDGSFLYKQIGPVERTRVVGTLTYEDGQYRVIANSKAYKVLLASVTYFKGNVGDKATIIIAANEESDWACIENILPDNE